MQSITITGRLGRDAKQFTSSKGVAFYSFTIAVDSKFKGNTITTWYDVVMPDSDRYRNMFKYLRKGTSLIVIGELSASLETYNEKPRLKLVISASNIYFNGSSNGNNSNSSNHAQQQTITQASQQPQQVQQNSVQQPQNIDTQTQQVQVGVNTVTEQQFNIDDNELPF